MPRFLASLALLAALSFSCGPVRAQDKIVIINPLDLHESAELIHETSFAFESLNECAYLQENWPLYWEEFSRLEQTGLVLEMVPDAEEWEQDGSVICGYAFLYDNQIYVTRKGLDHCDRQDTIAHEILHLIGLTHPDMVMQIEFAVIISACLGL